MTQPSISREKLIAHLKESIVQTGDIDNDFRFVYIAGRNMLAEILLMKIICGEMDVTDDHLIICGERVEK